MSQILTDPAQHAAATLKWLHPGSEVFEICLISPGQDKSPHWEGRAYGTKKIVAGWFRDQAKAVALVGQVKAEGIYLTLNPCQEALLARAHERLKANVSRSSDAEIAGLRNFLIDLDPKRPAGVSSTDNEHEVALLFAQQLKSELIQEGWPPPLVGDSGNGAHLIFPIELENNPENVELLKAALAALGQRYAGKLAELDLDLDLKVFNPARLSKLYGTRVGKGDNLRERPHRWARIVELPGERAPLSLKLLRDLAGSFLPAVSGGSGGNLRHPEKKTESRINLPAYLDHYGVEVVAVKDQGDAKLHVLEQCVFDATHGHKEASIGQTAEGKLFYQCFHNSCKGRQWPEAREIISGDDKLGQFMVGGAPAPARRTKGKLRLVGGGQTAAPGQEPPPEAPATEAYSWSDLGNARRLVALHGQDLRFNHLNKEWYHWTGHSWAVDNCGEAVRRAKNTVETIYSEAAQLAWDSEARKKMFSFALKSEAAGRIAAMLKLAQSEPGIPVLPEEFDADLMLFNCANGTIDLRTGELREHRREDLITCLSPVAFEPEATCPAFERFLYQIMGGRPQATPEEAAQASDLCDFLQLSLGYTLTGDTREQCFWILWGSGANGKGTLIDTITPIFGDYHANTSPETILMQDRNASQIRSDLARLDGPRLVTASEPDKGRRLAEGLLKGLSGQDTWTARFLYGKEFEFVPRFKLFVQTNNQPVIKDLTDGLWRKLKMIEFPMRFMDNPDRGLRERLQAERAGILAWMVRGCLAWQKHGDLMEPKIVKQTVQEYRDRMNPLKEFLDERVLIGPNLTATAHELYNDYSSFADDNLSKKEKLSKRAFGGALGEQGFRPFKGTGGVRSWRGLGLRTLI